MTIKERLARHLPQLLDIALFHVKNDLVRIDSIEGIQA